MNETQEKPESCSDSATAMNLVAAILCRLLVPSWLLAGAVYKLLELNPNLLPPPVISTSTWIGSMIGQDPQTWLGVSMRLMIATEITLAGVMYFAPRFSRIIAVGILALFVIILATVMIQGYDATKGLSSLLSGTCGCFGSSGPPPWAMLLIDATMLIAVIAAGPLHRRGCTKLTPVMILISAAIGFTLAFTAGAGQTAPDPSDDNVPVQLDENGWPPQPTTFEPYYFPQFEEWNGKELSTIPFAHLLPRPLPEGFNTGDRLIVYYRADCEHCQEMFLTYFSDMELATPTLAVGLPDYAPEAALEFLCTACDVTELPGVPPEYVIQTPVIVRLQDGVVTCVADGSADEQAFENCIIGSDNQ